MRQQRKYSQDTGGATVAARLACACLFAIAAAPVFAFGANRSSPAEAGARELAPGDYQWMPSTAPVGTMSMLINLGSQRAFVYRGDTLIGISTISSGKPGHETPDGTFTVLEKERHHHSNKYDDAPMPYMERLTWSGLALHGGHPRGYPASHGCIRLPMGFAAALFAEDTSGMQVVISGHAPRREEILTAARGNARTNSQCCSTNSPDESGSSQGTAAFGGENETGAPPQPPCCEPTAGAAPQGASQSEAGDQVDSGAYNGGVNPEPGQLQRNRPDTSQDQDEDNPVPPQAPPPQDLPPPPG
jgi:hypothetical protein